MALLPKFELVIFPESKKPFPYGAVATAFFINASEGGQNAIAITTQPATADDSPQDLSSAKLVRKAE